MAQRSKARDEIAETIKTIRTAMGLNQKDFAAIFEVDQSVISTWEQGKEVPSPRNYFRLGSIAADYRAMKLLWEEAGIDLSALDRFSDMRLQERGASSIPDLLQVPALDSKEKEIIEIPSRLLEHPASTRFVRIKCEGTPFKLGWQSFEKHDLPTAGQPFAPGDIILLDSLETDLRTLRRGTMVAVLAKGNCLVGTLDKRPSGIRDIALYLLRLGYKDIYLGSVKEAGGIARAEQLKSGELELYPDITVLGRVVGWFSPKQRKEKK